jgi:membrane protease YdiL (CAAX protease family)
MATTAAPTPAAEPIAATPIHPPEIPQYSLRKIMAVWAAAALPMAVLSWVLAPSLADGLDGPNALIKALLLCLTAGLVWQFALVVILVGREQGSLRWLRIRPALWLQAPRNPRTGRRSRRAWLLLPVLILGFAAEDQLQLIDAPVARDFAAFLDSTAGSLFLDGSWGWFAVIAALVVFNTVLGEELLFRGLLLPRMNGAFGRRDWLANGVLFAAYHLHMPWAIPATLIDTFVISYPSKRYRSAWIGIAVHSAQSVVILAVTLSLVAG